MTKSTSQKRKQNLPAPAELPAESPGSPLADASKAFPIVGIGSSAGGLEALEQFLSAVPADCGMAFVIVQHLDPTQKGYLTELIKRATRLAVTQVTDGTAVAPNCVYVIPPNADMSILRGTLYLFEPSLPRGQRLPIDFFFRSLATDQRENSVGVVLSGMGTDGTLGVRALKEVAGLVLVQDPAAAKFDGMPRSAVSTGMVDIVAPAEELYTRLVSVLSHAPQAIPVHSETEAKDQNALEKIVILLRTHTGHDFALYKKSTLYRRVERRMGLHQINKTDH
jgi:two-component system CheB/CheR fusion protein